jgi:hypothetical protein
MRGALKQLPRTTPPRELVRRFRPRSERVQVSAKARSRWFPNGGSPHRCRSFLAAASTLRSTGSRSRALPPDRPFSPSPAGVAGWRSTGKPPGELPARPKWDRRSRVGAAGRPAHRVGCRSLGGLPLLPGWKPERPRCHAAPVARRLAPREAAPRHPQRQRTGPSLRLFAECLSSGSPAARPLPGVAPLRNCGSTRNSRSVLVVPAHLDGFLRAADAGVSQPAPDEVRRVSVRTPLRLDRSPARADVRSLPLPRDALRTPRRTRDPSTRAPEPHTRRSSRFASPRPLPPCRFHDFEALLRSVGLHPPRSRCRWRERCSSFHGFCSPPGLSPPSEARRSSCEARREHPTARAASVRRERLATVAGRSPPWGS